MRLNLRYVLAAMLGVLACVLPARAGFHLMQIEQVIGGVNGDTSAQAIQLRMRSGGQNFLANSCRIRAWDANGANPVIIHSFTSNVSSGAAGARVLLTTAAFNALTTPPTTSDRTMTAIPASYLAGGKLTFESSNGITIYWAVAWGSYVGTNSGSLTNDADGQFSPAFLLPLPSLGASALQFDGLFGDASTNNLADYIVTVGSSTWVNNAGSSFLLSEPAPSGQCCLAGGECQVITETACLLLSGTWASGEVCPVGACNENVIGACCDGAACSVSTAFSCGLMGGEFRGEGSTCSEGAPNNYVVCCRANFDQESGVNVPDIFAFLSAWFGNLPGSDFDGNGTREVPDIFAFLSAWFAGCSG